MFIGGSVMSYFALCGIGLGLCFIWDGGYPPSEFGVVRFLHRLAGLGLIFQLLIGFWIWLRFFFPAFGADFPERKRLGRWHRSMVYHKWSCVLYGVFVMALPGGLMFLFFLPWLALAAGLSHVGVRRERMRRYA